MCEHTMPMRGVRRPVVDRTTPVLPAPTDWCLQADALAALAWADGLQLAAHVGDADLAALYDDAE